MANWFVRFAWHFGCAATLLGAISTAQGAADMAAWNQLAILRTIYCRKMGALFDAASVRCGESTDPIVSENDVVIGCYRGARRFWQETLKATPLLNQFRPLRY